MDLRSFRNLSADDTRRDDPAEQGSLLTVTQLNEKIRALVAGNPQMTDVMVCGEISNLSRPRSGHIYFSLKDEGGIIRTVMFRSAVMRLTFDPQNGMRVIARGSVSVYLQDGAYQLYLTALEPDGIGALHLAFEQRKKRLEEEGLFAAERKKALPGMPFRVGLITSPTGAAVRDMIGILGRRFPLAKVLLYPTLVQGDEAPQQLVAALSWFETHPCVDVIIIGRGGGSFEDLFAFNDEGLARAIAASPIPVISAVGHETDFTLCDFAADRRAPTPSAAAEIAVPDRQELFHRLTDRERRLRQQLSFVLQHAEKKFSLLLARAAFSHPESLLQEKQMRVDGMEARLLRAMQQKYDACLADFKEIAARFGNLNPLRVLGRGYCAAFVDGRAVSSVKMLSSGMRAELRFADGVAFAEIEEMKSTPAAAEKGENPGET